MDAAAVTTITSSVDFATIIVGLSAVFAALMVPLVARKGGRMLIGLLR